VIVCLSKLKSSTKLRSRDYFLVRLNRHQWHETTWFEPHLYSLDELRDSARLLKSLRTTTNPEFIAALGRPTKKAMPRLNASIPSNGGIISKGERNVSIFDLMRRYAYPIAWKFINIPGTLTQHLFDKFSVINAERCSPPLPVGEIRLSAQSVEKFCIEKRFVKPTRATSPLFG
jgi:hypothetical protein